MGMTIDEHLLYEMGYNTGFKDGIKGSILKADYEIRLKADMVDILDEIRVEIEMEKLEDSPNFCIKAHNIAIDRVLKIIDKYKAEAEET